MKKGALSINTVVIATIAILVLAVLSFLVYSTMQDWNTASACTAEGGRCVDQTANNGNPCGEDSRLGDNSENLCGNSNNVQKVCCPI